MPPATVSRRTFVAGAAAGLAASATSPALSGGHGDHGHRRSQVPPNPILGGFQVPDGPLFRVFAPGPPDVTLPFTQVALEGLDAETSTLTDFSGFAAVAFHVGTAPDRDGVQYNLETDIRAYQGPYVDTAGTKRFGTFAFI
jgi:hypothetical protein